MNKYRIVEETGNLTNEKRFYIEYQGTNLFGKKKWKMYYQYHPETHRRLLEFDTLEKAENWINYRVETVSKKFHYANTTDK